MLTCHCRIGLAMTLQHVDRSISKDREGQCVLETQADDFTQCLTGLCQQLLGSMLPLLSHTQKAQADKHPQTVSNSMQVQIYHNQSNIQMYNYKSPVKCWHIYFLSLFLFTKRIGFILYIDGVISRFNHSSSLHRP